MLGFYYYYNTLPGRRQQIKTFTLLPGVWLQEFGMGILDDADDKTGGGNCRIETDVGEHPKVSA